MALLLLVLMTRRWLLLLAVPLMMVLMMVVMEVMAAAAAGSAAALFRNDTPKHSHALASTGTTDGAQTSGGNLVFQGAWREPVAKNGG